MTVTLEPPKTVCALCAQDLPKNPVVDGELPFCCPGCHAVYNILSTTNQLDQYQEHPVFLQAVHAGLISNPQLLEEVRQRNATLEEDELQKLHIEVSEMWCPSCAEVIRLMLLQEKGVKHVVVDYSTDLAAVEFAPRYLSKEKIYGIIRKLGYQAHPLEDARRPAVSRHLYLRLGVAAVCWLNIMMFAYPLYIGKFQDTPYQHERLFAWLSLLAAIPVITYSAWPIIRRFGSSLSLGIFGMETLVLMGVGAAFSLSLYELLQGKTDIYFDSMSAIVVFVLLGKIIEARAKFSARESLMALSRALPRRGRKRFSDGSERFVPLKEIAVGDTLVVCMGEKVVLDGMVMSGEGACDESLMTGESRLVPKSRGNPVLGGSILRHGNLLVQVTTEAEESALQSIIRMVEGGLGQKNSYVRAADRVVQWFVPSVLCIAAGTGLLLTAQGASLEEAALRAISILLISCPCALGIAAPLAESLLMSGLARMGAIVRNRGCLEILGKETRLVVDKTGTVTEGRYALLLGLEKLSDDNKKTLKALTQRSMHPVSCAISEAILGSAEPLEEVTEYAGKGLKAKRDGDVFLLGSEGFLTEEGIPIDVMDLGDYQTQMQSQVYFAKNGKLLCTLQLGDRLRQGVRDAILDLNALRPTLLSGDSEGAVKAVAQAAGFTDCLWRCLPAEKRAVVEKLRKQGERVCMLGDGINDAPALAAADIGISVLTATDMSIQVSDILLTTDRLTVLKAMRKLASKGRRIVKQNLFWAFFYNVLGMGLAVSGYLHPLFAAAAMVTSSIIVVLNALRLR